MVSESHPTPEFGDAEATRLRRIDLERSTAQDFPCIALIVDPTAVGAAVGMVSNSASTMTRWLWLVETGYGLSLARSVAIECGKPMMDHEQLPMMDDYLAQHDVGDVQLLEFSRRLLRLPEEQRQACCVGLEGAPPGSETPEFSPARRGYIRGIGTPVAGVERCDTHTHAGLIRLALEAIGPAARVETRLSGRNLREGSFRPLWCMATEARMPWLWMGEGDPHEGLTALYIHCCARLVRNEYDHWLWKASPTLSDDNPILRWLSAPNEPNRLVAMNFALRHALEGTRDDRRIESGNTVLPDQASWAIELTGGSKAGVLPDTQLDDNGIHGQTTPRSAARPKVDDQPLTLTPFEGGSLVFFNDRVELCGAIVCNGNRVKRLRKALELLRCKREDGSFVQYSAQELADGIGITAGQNGAAALIRSLRKRIRKQLRIQTSIECGHCDVIISGGPGYRFKDWISVHVHDTDSGDGMKGGDAQTTDFDDPS